MLPSKLKLIAVVGILALTFFAGFKVCDYYRDSLELAVQRGASEAANKAAEAISQIKINNTTIRQTLEKEVRENTVYTDCKHTPDGLQSINDAINNANQGKLPTTNTSK